MMDMLGLVSALVQLLRARKHLGERVVIVQFVGACRREDVGPPFLFGSPSPRCGMSESQRNFLWRMVEGQAGHRDSPAQERLRPGPVYRYVDRGITFHVDINM